MTEAGATLPAVKTDSRADWAIRAGFVALCLAAVFYINFRYVLVHFSKGGDLLDSGWFAWIITSGDPWLDAPRSVGGGSFFNHHLTPYLSLLSVALHATGIDRFTAFALHQAFVFTLFAASLFALPLSFWTGRKSAVLLIAVALSAVSGDAVLQVASYPHPEMATAAFCTLGAALWLNGRRGLATAAFLLACVVREDGGLYAGVFLLGLGVISDTPLFRRPEWLLGIGSIVVSVVMFAIKTKLFPEVSNFSYDFSGNNWDHLTGVFIAGRLADFAANPQAATVVLAALILAIASWRYLTFLVLMLPLIAVQLIAARVQLGHFTLYYAMPFIVIWAGLVLVAADRARRRKLRALEPAVLLACAVLGSGPVVFALKPPGSFPVLATALVTEVVDLPALADEAAATTRAAPGACVSTGVAALIPGDLDRSQVVGPDSDLSACRTIFLFNADLHYPALKPRVAGYAPGPVIAERIERYDQRP